MSKELNIGKLAVTDSVLKNLMEPQEILEPSASVEG
jgi:hypothetical protein